MSAADARIGRIKPETEAGATKGTLLPNNDGKPLGTGHFPPYHSLIFLPSFRSCKMENYEVYETYRFKIP
jgi:hypothetical protein